MKVTNTELQDILTGLTDRQTFSGVLLRATTKELLFETLNEYVEFNAVFGAGVACLSGNIALRSVMERVFLNPDPQFPTLDDASYEVAAAIFEAAIEEFGGGPKGKHTHRTLALATVKATALALGISKLEDVRQSTCDAIHMVVNGYGIGQTLDDQAMFKAMGFHAGSEVLADEEMNGLDSQMKKRDELNAMTQRMTFVIFREASIPSYAWVKTHCSVETEHYEAALRAINLALRFYTGDKTLAKQWFFSGFRQFVDAQQKFLSGL